MRLVYFLIFCTGSLISMERKPLLQSGPPSQARQSQESKKSSSKDTCCWLDDDMDAEEYQSEQTCSFANDCCDCSCQSLAFCISTCAGFLKAIKDCCAPCCASCEECALDHEHDIDDY